MSEATKITTPLTDEVIKGLKIGEKVSISGVIYSARDAAHKRLVELVEKGEDLPFELPGSVIYFVGPAPAKPGYAVGSAGERLKAIVYCFTGHRWASSLGTVLPCFVTPTMASSLHNVIWSCAVQVNCSARVKRACPSTVLPTSFETLR